MKDYERNFFSTDDNSSDACPYLFSDRGKIMSVLIKGMEMPTSCLSCPLQGGTADCRLTQKTYNWGLFERPSDCPLIEIPPHGRLIDADELMKDGWKLYRQLLKTGGYAIEEKPLNYPDIPTIIEAEEGE